MACLFPREYGVVYFVVYVCVARRYKYIERDEPCNILCQYAEEYYSSPQQENTMIKSFPRSLQALHK